MSCECDASIDAVVGQKPASSPEAKVRHHCILPGCQKQIRKKNEAAPITSSLMSIYPILKSWVKTVHNTVVGDNGFIRLVSTIVYDRWHKACKKQFYLMLYDGVVTNQASIHPSIRLFIHPFTVLRSNFAILPFGVLTVFEATNEHRFDAEEKIIRR
jgi:hypothetical protein